MKIKRNINEFRLIKALLLVGLFLLVTLQAFAQTATITSNATVCQGATAPTITFTGSAGTPDYTFTYTINGGGPLTISTTGGTSIVTLPASTSIADTITYSLVSVTDGNLITQSATGSVTVVVNPLAF